MKHRLLEISRIESFHSALTFDSKPIQGAVPIQSQMDPSALVPAYSTTPDRPILRVGSVADIGVLPSTFIQPGEPPHVETVESESEDESEPEEPPKLPSPSRTSKNLEANRKKALCVIQADFQACNEFSPSSDPGAALAAIDSTLSQLNASVDIAMYLPEPQ
jgi:hypothetical protein